MRIILPLILAAIWFSGSVKIEGVWPPLPAAATLTSIVQQIDQPRQRLLTGVSALTSHGKLDNHSFVADSAVQSVREITLSAPAKPPHPPTC